MDIVGGEGFTLVTQTHGTQYMRVRCMRPGVVVGTTVRTLWAVVVTSGVRGGKLVRRCDRCRAGWLSRRLRGSDGDPRNTYG